MPKHNKRVYTHLTDDPVEAEEFLMHLLITSALIKEIRHEGKVLKWTLLKTYRSLTSPILNPCN